jgi:hypothetical protein
VAVTAELYSIPLDADGLFEPGRGGLIAWYRGPEGRGTLAGMPYYPLPASATAHNPEYDALLKLVGLLGIECPCTASAVRRATFRLIRGSKN